MSDDQQHQCCHVIWRAIFPVKWEVKHVLSLSMSAENIITPNYPTRGTCIKTCCAKSSLKWYLKFLKKALLADAFVSCLSHSAATPSSVQEQNSLFLFFFSKQKNKSSREKQELGLKIWIALLAEDWLQIKTTCQSGRF